VQRRFDGFEIQGHRGARGLFPENTLDGFRAAIALGVRVLELDTAITADGVAVAFHDDALNPEIVRGGDGRWIAPPGALIRHLTAAELGAFDVGRLRPGSDYGEQHSSQVPVDGARIPTLREILRLTVAAGARVDIELKTLPAAPERTTDPDTMAACVLAAVEGAGALALADIRSFDWRGLRAVRRHGADLPLTFLTSAATAADPVLWWQRPLAGSIPRTVAAEHPQATWAPELATLTREALEEAHALGLRVVPWTVNAPADMRRLVAWGADGLCTDRPDLAFEVLRAVS
jgi:glycerophosphoryl diester phosphodiesterase